MSPIVRIVVLDTGPLITLAAADALDYLRYPLVPVLIPDAVFYEATVKHGALGAADLVDWAQANAGAVQIVPTAAFADVAARVDVDQPFRQKDLGERAALEVIKDVLTEEALETAVFLIEDQGAIRQISAYPRPGQIIPISTTDFLRLLEDEGRINSADAVLRAAEDAGRFASRMELLKDTHERGVTAVRAVLKRPDDAEI
jgi:hypothetical protein